MTRTNQIIEALKIAPQIASELPYRVSRHRLGIEDRTKLRKLHLVWGRKKTKNVAHGTFETVYFLDGDEDRAIRKFAEVNYDAMSQIDFSGNNFLHSGMPKGVGKKIIREFKNIKHQNQKVYKV